MQTSPREIHIPLYRAPATDAQVSEFLRIFAARPSVAALLPEPEGMTGIEAWARKHLTYRLAHAIIESDATGDVERLEGLVSHAGRRERFTA